MASATYEKYSIKKTFVNPFYIINANIVPKFGRNDTIVKYVGWIVPFTAVFVAAVLS